MGETRKLNYNERYDIFMMLYVTYFMWNFTSFGINS